MGEPDSTTDVEVLAQIALAALGPKGKVPAKLLRETGLHREVLRRYMASLQPEIKYLVGWKMLEEYDYPKTWRDSSESDRKKGKQCTGRWYAALEAAELSFEHAVLIYDGELQSMPEPDYRLFVLRDGRLLYYNGGHYSRHSPLFPDRSGIVCGDAVEVLDHLDRVHPGYDGGSISVNTTPLLIIMKALDRALGIAIDDRERKVDAQKALRETLQRVIRQVDK